MVDYAVYIIVAIIVGALTLVGCAVFIIQFQHPDDRLTAWLPKIVVLVGLFLTCAVVLLLPFDASMSQSCAQDPSCSAVSGLATTWYVAFISVAIMAFAVIPFTYFWYESDDDEGLASRICSTICSSVVFLGVFVAVLMGMYLTIGYVELPVEIIFPPGYNDTSSKSTVSYLKVWNPANPPVPAWSQLTGNAKRIEAIQNIQTSLVIYILALLSFLGWILLTGFAGIGLITVPADLVAAWYNRPVPIDLKKFAEKKLELKKKCDELIAIGKEQRELFRKKSNKRKERYFTNKYKKMVLDLEEELQIVNLCYKKNEINPLLPWLNLSGGIFAVVLSVSWFFQILLQILLQGKYPFLNVIFTNLTAAFPLFGVVAYGIFAFYIMITIIAGSVKFAGRFFLISMHPMKLNGTMMNSFLFNVGILLICSVAAIQLCTTAFSQFANSSAIAQIFVVQIQYLKGLNFFYSVKVPVFYYLLYVVAFTQLIYSLICCMCCAKKQADNVNDAMNQLRREMRE